jgi:hypothetical protein
MGKKKLYQSTIQQKEEIRGRIKFIGINTFGEKVSNKAGMHDSMVVIFKP